MADIRVAGELVMTGIRLSSAGEIFRSIRENTHYLRRWLPFVDETYSVSQTEAYIRSVLDGNSLKKDLVWEIRKNGELVGVISLKEVDDINGRTEIGYWIREIYEGHGIVTDCCRKLIDYAFNELHLFRVQIRVAPGNLRSARVPERLGFRFEGIERAGEKHSDKYLDLMVYSLLKPEWGDDLSCI